MNLTAQQVTDAATRASVLASRTRSTSKCYRARLTYAADMWARASVAWIGIDAARSNDCLDEAKAFTFLATEAA